MAVNKIWVDSKPKQNPSVSSVSIKLYFPTFEVFVSKVMAVEIGSYIFYCQLMRLKVSLKSHHGRCTFLFHVLRDSVFQS